MGGVDMEPGERGGVARPIGDKAQAAAPWRRVMNKNRQLPKVVRRTMFRRATMTPLRIGFLDGRISPQLCVCMRPAASRRGGNFRLYSPAPRGAALSYLADRWLVPRLPIQFAIMGYMAERRRRPHNERIFFVSAADVCAATICGGRARCIGAPR